MHVYAFFHKTKNYIILYYSVFTNAQTFKHSSQVCFFFHTQTQCTNIFGAFLLTNCAKIKYFTNTIHFWFLISKKILKPPIIAIINYIFPLQSFFIDIMKKVVKEAYFWS